MMLSFWIFYAFWLSEVFQFPVKLCCKHIWKNKEYWQWMKLHLESVWTICPSIINFVLPFSTFDLPSKILYYCNIIMKNSQNNTNIYLVKWWSQAESFCIQSSHSSSSSLSSSSSSSLLSVPEFGVSDAWPWMWSTLLVLLLRTVSRLSILSLPPEVNSSFRWKLLQQNFVCV